MNATDHTFIKPIARPTPMKRSWQATVSPKPFTPLVFQYGSDRIQLASELPTFLFHPNGSPKIHTPIPEENSGEIDRLIIECETPDHLRQLERITHLDGQQRERQIARVIESTHPKNTPVLVAAAKLAQEASTHMMILEGHYNQPELASVISEISERQQHIAMKYIAQETQQLMDELEHVHTLGEEHQEKALKDVIDKTTFGNRFVLRKAAQMTHNPVIHRSILCKIRDDHDVFRAVSWYSEAKNIHQLLLSRAAHYPDILLSIARKTDDLETLEDLVTVAHRANHDLFLSILGKLEEGRYGEPQDIRAKNSIVQAIITKSHTKNRWNNSERCLKITHAAAQIHDLDEQTARLIIHYSRGNDDVLNNVVERSNSLTTQHEIVLASKGNPNVLHQLLEQGTSDEVIMSILHSSRHYNKEQNPLQHTSILANSALRCESEHIGEIVLNQADENVTVLAAVLHANIIASGKTDAQSALEDLSDPIRARVIHEAKQTNNLDAVLAEVHRLLIDFPMEEF